MPSVNTNYDQALLQTLVKYKAIPPELAATASAEGKSGVALEEFLITTAHVGEEDITRAKAEAVGLAYHDLRDAKIAAEVLALLPKSVSETHKAVAFARSDNTVSIGLANPGDYQAIETLEFLAGERELTFRYFGISGSAYRDAARQYEAAPKEVAKALEAAKEKFTPRVKEKKEVVSEETLKGAPVSRIMQVVMEDAVTQGASDIHIEPSGKMTRVRYRIDGVLRNTLSLPVYIHQAIVSRVKVLAHLKLDETRVPQDGRIGLTVEGRQIDFRVSTLPLMDTEKVVMRILDTSFGVPTLQMLGFRAEHRAIIEDEIKRPFGMMLVSGPTGSGKSTTLYTILNMLNAEGINIITLEDPIEYYLPGVNQSQIRPEIGYTFATGLRSILRQDPNVIMVGEIRDRETAELAIHAALTGHLLFSTIHTNDSLGVITRLQDMGAEAFLVAPTLNVVVAQRLARKICSECRVSVAVPARMTERVKSTLEKIPSSYFPKGMTAATPSFFRGQGCDACGKTGYQGRVAVAEVLRVTPEMQQLITEGFTPAKAAELAAKQGMIGLFQDGLLKAMEGQTTLEEVLRVAEE